MAHNHQACSVETAEHVETHHHIQETAFVGENSKPVLFGWLMVVTKLHLSCGHYVQQHSPPAGWD